MNIQRWIILGLASAILIAGAVGVLVYIRNQTPPELVNQPSLNVSGTPKPPVKTSTVQATGLTSAQLDERAKNDALAKTLPPRISDTWSATYRQQFEDLAAAHSPTSTRNKSAYTSTTSTSH